MTCSLAVTKQSRCIPELGGQLKELTVIVENGIYTNGHTFAKERNNEKCVLTL